MKILRLTSEIKWQSDNKIPTYLKKSEDAKICFDKHHMMKSVWKKEINQDYDLYLASLRANRDAVAILEERNNLVKQLQEQQTVNINLRKDIRAYERELYIMLHKNAHKSCVIDGLHEVDQRTKIAKLLNAEKLNCLALEKKEGNMHEEIISSLRNGITLLKSKTEADCHLISTLKPHKSRLKGTLDSIELDIHQNCRRFQRDLQSVLDKFKECHSHFDHLLQKTYEKRGWIGKAYAEMKQEKVENLSVFNNEASSNMLKEKELDTPDKEDGKEDDNQKTENHLKLTSEIQLMMEENNVVSTLIESNFSRIISGVNEFIEEITWLYEMKCDQSLIKEYIERLHIVRKKQEFTSNRHPTNNTQLMEELKLKLNIFSEEGSLILRLLNHYLTSISEAFQADRVYVNTSINLFGKELQAEKN